MKKRYTLLAIAVLMAMIATTAQTLTITTSTGSKQYSASDITSNSPATFSNNGTKMTIGSKAFNIGEIINALVVPENPGHVKDTCGDCEGNALCKTCHGTGKGCTVCNGTGKYCTKCDGTGNHTACNGTGMCPYCYYGECSRCEGSGRNSCSYCFGNGDCTGCGGAGTYKGITCTTCKGNGRCPKCNGSGSTGSCTKCSGSGKCDSCNGNRQCSSCNGTGNCIYCGGNPRCYFCGGDGHCSTCKNSDGKCNTCSGKGYVWVDIKLSDTSLKLSYKGESKDISITINQSWRVTCSSSWITLTNAVGKNSGIITIHAEPNLSENSRSATVVISYGGKTEYVTVSQEGIPYLRLSKTDVDFAAIPNGSETISISSNCNWYASSNQDWLTISPANGVGNGSISLTASDNPTMDLREAIVTLRYGDNTVTIDVSQAAGEGTIRDAISSTVFAHDGEFQWLYIVASDRREWTVIRPANDTWVHFDTSSNTSQIYSGIGSIPLKIYVDRNENTMGRVSSLSIISGSYTHTIYIVQDGGTMVLRDMLVKPFGVFDVDLTTASYNTVYNTLVNMFTLETNSYSFYVDINYNRTLTGMTLCGLKLWYFGVRNLLGYNTYSYAFFIGKSNVSNFNTYITATFNEFSNLGIGGWKSYDYSDYYCYESRVGNATYTIYIEQDESFYYLTIDATYK